MNEQTTTPNAAASNLANVAKRMANAMMETRDALRSAIMAELARVEHTPEDRSAILLAQRAESKLWEVQAILERLSA